MDPITAALTAINTATGIFTAIKNLDKQMDAVQYKEKIIELSEALFETKKSILELKETILEKDSVISELTNKLNEKSNLVFDNYYWVQTIDGEKHYYCPRCYSKSKAVNPLTKSSDVEGLFHCTVCNLVVTDANYKKPEPPLTWAEELGLQS